jgi:hypothetical protein
MAFLTIAITSCSSMGGVHNRVATAATPADAAAAEKKAAQRKRWEAQVERDNALDSSGSEPGYYGSFGRQFSW